MAVAKLVFMTTNSYLSRLIRWDGKGSVSHVCAFLDDGTAISANLGQGVVQSSQAVACDKASLLIRVDIPMITAQYDIWVDYLKRRIGEPFDARGAFGVSLPFDFHTEGALFCAALQLGALRKCERFPRELSLKFHMVSPVVLLMMLQSQPLETVTIHDPETVKFGPEQDLG